MDADTAEAAGAPSSVKALRRERISFGSGDRAQERLSEQRVRKIVADALKRQEGDDPPDHALPRSSALERT
jgi:hypothetical protein